MVDIHNEDRRDELDPKWQEAFVRFWGLLAGRLSRFDPDLTILEIVNEPVFDRREEEWNTLNARLAAAIRQAAPRHTIITSGPNWGGIDGLKKLKLLPDRNVIYSFHCYDPFAFTHQGATWAGPAVKPLHDVPYPSSPEAVEPLLAALESSPDSKRMVESYGKERWNKEKLAARFRQGIEWGARNRVPLYCGEFGVFPARSKPEDRSRWFHDFGEVLAENRIGWAVWGWDEGFGLNRRMVNGKPVVDAVVAQGAGTEGIPQHHDLAKAALRNCPDAHKDDLFSVGRPRSIRAPTHRILTGKPLRRRLAFGIEQVKLLVTVVGSAERSENPLAFFRLPSKLVTQVFDIAHGFAREENPEALLLSLTVNEGHLGFVVAPGIALVANPLTIWRPSEP